MTAWLPWCAVCVKVEIVISCGLLGGGDLGKPKKPKNYNNRPSAKNPSGRMELGGSGHFLDYHSIYRICRHGKSCVSQVTLAVLANPRIMVNIIKTINSSYTMQI